MKCSSSRRVTRASPPRTARYVAYALLARVLPQAGLRMPSSDRPLTATLWVKSARLRDRLSNMRRAVGKHGVTVRDQDALQRKLGQPG